MPTAAATGTVCDRGEGAGLWVPAWALGLWIPARAPVILESGAEREPCQQQHQAVTASPGAGSRCCCMHRPHAAPAALPAVHDEADCAGTECCGSCCGAGWGRHLPARRSAGSLACVAQHEAQWMGRGCCCCASKWVSEGCRGPQPLWPQSPGCPRPRQRAEDPPTARPKMAWFHI